jgi:hypothetical protein
MELLRETMELSKRGQRISTESAEQFIAQLLRIPLAEWRGYAMNDNASFTSDAARALEEATEVLEHAIRLPDTLYAAWLVRDHVETAYYRFRSAEGRRQCPPSRVRDVRIATERAALALLLRSWLSDEHFLLLRGGFTALDLTPSPSAPPR